MPNPPPVVWSHTCGGVLRPAVADEEFARSGMQNCQENCHPDAGHTLLRYVLDQVDTSQTIAGLIIENAALRAELAKLKEFLSGAYQEIELLNEESREQTATIRKLLDEQSREAEYDRKLSEGKDER